MENIYSQNTNNSNFTSNMKQKSNETLRENFRNEKLKDLQIENLEMRPICRMNKYTETSDCRCKNEICNEEEDCGYACAQSISVGEITGREGKFDKNFKSVVSDISTSIRKTFDNIHMSRIIRGDDSPFESYQSWQKPCQVRNSTNGMSNKRGKFIISSKVQCNPRCKIIENTAIRKIEQCRMTREKKNFNFTNKKCIDENSDFSPISCYKEIRGDASIVCESGSYPMLITNDQGLLEIHIMRLQLTSMGSGMFSTKENTNDLSLFVTWDIWNQEKAFTPSLKYPKFNFNSSSIYRLSRLFEFFDSALGQSISFKVHVSHRDDTSCPVARAYLSIKDILDYPQNKLHYVVNFSSILPCSYGQDFGQLSLWIRLSCDFEKLELFKKRKKNSSNSSVSKKISKIKTRNDKNIYRTSLNSQLTKQSISTDLHEINVRSSKNLHSKTSLRLENAAMGKEILQSSPIDNNNFSSFQGTSTITRTSKDSGVKKFTSEASSSGLQRSPINMTSINEEKKEFEDESYLSISRETSAVKRSDSSIIRTMEGEETTSEETHNGMKKHESRSPVKLFPEAKKKSKEDEKVETASIKEFNNLIHNVTEKNDKILSPRESRSSVQDVGSVFKDDNWQEYRRRSMAPRKTSSRPSNVSEAGYDVSKSSYPFPNYSTSNNDAVIIRIESLSLFQTCPLLSDPDIHRLYVEFSFLGYRGVELETISVPKPPPDTKAYLNYMRKFEIDKKEHSTQRMKMRAMMREDNNSTIKFIIVSEPLLEEMDTKECIEVGYAYFDIRDHISRGRLRDVSLTIKNSEQTESIGILQITLLGAEAIRRCMFEL